MEDFKGSLLSSPCLLCAMLLAIFHSVLLSLDNAQGSGTTFTNKSSLDFHGSTPPTATVTSRMGHQK